MPLRMFRKVKALEVIMRIIKKLYIVVGLFNNFNLLISYLGYEVSELIPFKIQVVVCLFSLIGSIYFLKNTMKPTAFYNFNIIVLFSTILMVSRFIIHLSWYTYMMSK